jgi:hypothetical protein
MSTTVYKDRIRGKQSGRPLLAHGQDHSRFLRQTSAATRSA